MSAVVSKFKTLSSAEMPQEQKDMLAGQGIRWAYLEDNNWFVCKYR